MPIWEQLKTEDGQTYYYNKETEETSWTLPEGEEAAVERQSSLCRIAAAFRPDPAAPAWPGDS